MSLQADCSSHVLDCSQNSIIAAGEAWLPSQKRGKPNRRTILGGKEVALGRAQACHGREFTTWKQSLLAG
jgi:hypothetical protein